MGDIQLLQQWKLKANKDLHCQIYEYVKDGKYPKGFEKSEKQSLDTFTGKTGT